MSRILLLVFSVSITFALGNNAQSQPANVPQSETQSEAEQIEAIFLSGLRDLEQGNTGPAIEKFSAILAENPNLVRVRLELGLAYFLARQWNRARNEFFTVLSGNLPEPVRIRVLNLIREIDARRGFDWDFSLGITNVGDQRNYDTDEILLNFSGVDLPFRLNRDRTSEVGIRATGSANFRQPLNAKVFGADTVGFASLSFDVTEARNSQYDDYIFGARFGIRALTRNTTASFGPVLTTRLIGGNVFENRIALQAAFERRTEQGVSVFAILNAAELHNPTTEFLDGHEYDAELGIRRSFGGRGTIGASVFLQSKDVDDNLENFIRRRFTIFGQVDTKGGFTLRPSVYVERKSFRTRNILFTGNPDEDTWGGAIRVEKNDLFFGNGFSPFLLVTYQRTKSGIEAFSYSESGFELGLERRF